MNIDQAKQLIAGHPWHHAFEVIPGVRTQGSYDPTFLLEKLDLPKDLSGVTVADLGASNGYFSFVLRQRGARVTAFDFRHKDNSGFGLLQLINGLDDITHHHINVLDVTADRFGQFDIVLCLGLLYHVSEPYRLLSNCAGLDKHKLFVETYCIDKHLPVDFANIPLARFIPDPERLPGYQQPNQDTSNFWGFTSKCVELMIRDLGYHVERVEVWRSRCLVEAQAPQKRVNRDHIAYGLIPHVPVGQNPLDSKSWTIF